MQLRSTPRCKQAYPAIVASLHHTGLTVEVVDLYVGAQKRQIVDRIIEERSMHAAIEEQVLYPVSRAAVPDTEDIVRESLEEHHVVK